MTVIKNGVTRPLDIIYACNMNVIRFADAFVTRFICKLTGVVCRKMRDKIFSQKFNLFSTYIRDRGRDDLFIGVTKTYSF